MSSQSICCHSTAEKIIRYALNNAIPAINELDQRLTEKGYSYLKNHTISNYNFDFYWPNAKVAIEIDGYAHEFSEIFNQDMAKKLFISSLGITVLRFTDYQILVDIEEIFRALKQEVNQSKTNSCVV